MGRIQIIGEDNSPRIVCGNCKNLFKVDIRPFQKDMSQIAKYDCPVCKTEVFAGLLLLGNTKFDGLLDMITTVSQTLGEAGANVESVGNPGQNAKPKIS